MSRRTEQFQTIRSEGAILPPDLLQRIAGGDVEGLDPATYHLPTGVKPKEAIAQCWTRMLRHWQDFQAARKLVPEADDTGGVTTREKWLLPLFQELGYGRLTTSKAPEIDGKRYPIERFWNHVPIHLMGFKLPLDHRTKGARGAATAIPHSMVQEFLNRAPGHLWAILSNGLQLRILRDNAALSRQSYVEFDLESMMEGEVYPDFTVLWLLCHESRLEADKPEDCWLEKWSKLAADQGTRMLQDLRKGVAKSIEALGRGFLAHPQNGCLIEKLRSGELNRDDYYRQILRIVYRLLFLFVAEDRGLLHPPAPEVPDEAEAYEAACRRYNEYYSMRRLREMSEGYRGSKHADLWNGVSLIFDALGRDSGCPQLGLPALGSFLWSKGATKNLNGPPPKGAATLECPAFLRNEDLLEAIRSLAFVEKSRALWAVDYRNLGSEEFGSVYESLLELKPELNTPSRTFALLTVAGNDRKLSGSYYTPDSLVQCLLDSALEPVVADAVKGKAGQDAEKALLDLKVCDPACGSGHFLIGAAHRLARHLARIRTGETEPSPQEYQHALRDVIRRCIFGVDINPMAVELCKVSLWMESLEPGKPLSFLDHRILCGNSLIGATPRLIKEGIPDDAFKPIEGDDKAVCSEYKRRNKDERKGQMTFGWGAMPEWKLGNLAETFANVLAADDETLESLEDKERRYVEFVKSTSYENARLLADSWCAAFVWKKDKTTSDCITYEWIRRIEAKPFDLSPWMRDEVRRLRNEYQFFHWHLAFPDVFRLTAGDVQPENEQAGWSGGFNVMLGNPPWERIKLQEKEWFAMRCPEIASMADVRRRRERIASLAQEDPSLWEEYRSEARRAEGESHTARSGGRFPLCGTGDINTYSVFAELNCQMLSPTGRVGCIVPSGIATDDISKAFFQHLVESQRLRSLYDFENREALFAGVHRSYRFCLLTISGSPSYTPVILAFFLGSPRDLQADGRTFSLDSTDFIQLNPNTRTCPIFRSGRDASLTLKLYRRCEVIRSERDYAPNSLRLRTTRMFDMNKQRSLFETGQELEEKGCDDVLGCRVIASTKYLPLFEGKAIDAFDHRYASSGLREGGGIRTGTALPASDAERSDPHFIPRRLLFIDENKVNDWSQGRLTRKWILALMDVTAATNHRTVVSAMLPDVATDYSIRVVILKNPSAEFAACLLALFNSFAFDYIARQKLSGLHLSDYITYQLAVPSSEELLRARGRLVPASLELTYTSWDMEPFSADCGYSGQPFKWDQTRRSLLRCELDAACFHIYGIERDEAAHILETFPIVKRADEAAHGYYRTKDTILEIYDAMAESIRTGRPYQTRLDPPPGPPCDIAGNFIPTAQWDQAIWDRYRDVIHPPKEIGLPAGVTAPPVPAEVDLGGLTALTYPATDADRAICGAALAVIEQAGGLSSIEHLDALLLATHPDWCKAFLIAADQRRLRAAVTSAPAELFVADNEAIHWKDCRDYLEQHRKALKVDHADTAQPIRATTALTTVKAALPSEVDEIASLALKALERVRALRQGAAAATQEQQRLLAVFRRESRASGLAVA